MAEIKFNSDDLRSVSGEIKTQGANFQSVTSEFTQTLNSLSAEWEGDAFNEFKSRVDDLQPSFEAYYNVINEYADFLMRSADTYDETETQTGIAADDLANDLFQG